MGGLVALVERARSGDAAAWEALYRRAYPRVHAYARRRLPSDDAAREAIGEVMARAVRSIGSYRGDGAGFDAWVASIARHVVLDLQRRRARRPEAALSATADWADGSLGADELVERDEEAAAVRRAFELLPDADRELLEMRVVMGLSSDAVAEALGKRPGTVRMAQARALARLRAILERNEAVQGV